jgi:hypothetical protein
MTNDEKRQAIETALRETPAHSDRAIADQLGVSHTTIGKVRAELETAGDVPKLAARIDTTGRTQPATKRQTGETRCDVTTAAAVDHPLDGPTVRPVDTAALGAALAVDIDALEDERRQLDAAARVASGAEYTRLCGELAVVEAKLAAAKRDQAAAVAARHAADPLVAELADIDRRLAALGVGLGALVLDSRGDPDAAAALAQRDAETAALTLARQRLLLAVDEQASRDAAAAVAARDARDAQARMDRDRYTAAWPPLLAAVEQAVDVLLDAMWAVVAPAIAADDADRLLPRAERDGRQQEVCQLLMEETVMRLAGSPGFWRLLPGLPRQLVVPPPDYGSPAGTHTIHRRAPAPPARWTQPLYDTPPAVDSYEAVVAGVAKYVAQTSGPPRR